MNILFSIIIPTFNRADALDKCLKSLTNQTYKNFEVIVCDDGSTDNTVNVIEKFSEKINLTYYFNENWGGPARPRNLGFSKAKGEWVCFLDSDDWYQEDRLHYLSTTIDDSFDIYHHRLLGVSDTQGISGRIPTWQMDNNNPGLDLLINFNGILTSSTCIRRSKLLELDYIFSENKKIIGLEDFDLWIRLGFAGAKFKLIKLDLGYYSTGGDDHITFLDERQINRLSELYNLNSVHLSSKQKVKSIAALQYQKACLLRVGKDYINARKCFIQALKAGSLKVRFRSLYKLLVQRT